MPIADVKHGHGQASKLRRLVAAVRLPLSKKSDSPPTPAPSSNPNPNPNPNSNPKPGPNPPSSPQLPPELWILIIRHATSPSSSTTSSPEPVSFLSHPHSAPRLASHRALMRRKARLTLVCRAWHAHAQPVLFEFVWLARERQARLLARVLAGTAKGRHIRRLHVETPALERCSAADLRTILDHAPALAVYSDYRSVRRRNTLHPPLQLQSSPRLGAGTGVGATRCVTTFAPHTDPASPDSLLAALARPGNALRRLSWTNYDDISFHLRLSPLLLATGANLEFLELNFCSQLDAGRGVVDSAVVLPCAGEGAYATATALTLPALSALKVTLDNATFAVLATWDMPALRNLSVLAADFSYYSASARGGTGTGTGERAPSGFELFFLTHGEKVEQLELGHSSSVIEEHWVTAPPRRGGVPGVGEHQQHGMNGTGRIPLSTWCPNLTTFICSADAEWNWQSPDWIAPHVLLPAHPGVRFIGVRDIGKRIVEGLAAAGGGGEGGEGDFFVLGEQIGSLLRREAFPSLLYVRDMSYGSDVLRRGGEAETEEGEFDGDGASTTNPKTTTTTTSMASTAAPRRWPWARLDQPRSTSDLGRAARGRGQQDRARVLRFWAAVLERCRAGGVWLEDWRGVNITVGDLRRAGVGVGVGV